MYALRESLEIKVSPNKYTYATIILKDSHLGDIFVTYPKLQKHFMFKKTFKFKFIVKFVIIDQVGSRMIVFNC